VREPDDAAAEDGQAQLPEHATVAVHAGSPDPAVADAGADDDPDTHKATREFVPQLLPVKSSQVFKSESMPL